MANKREQRLRRKSRKALSAIARERDAALKLKPVALAAIRYVNEIDARNPHEPWSIANRRDELRDVVHAVQGRPGRGVRREPSAVRAAAVETGRVVAPVLSLTQPLPPRMPIRASAATKPVVSDERMLRDLEVKRVELHNAAARYGAEANKRVRDARRVAALGVALDAASKAFAAVEARVNARRAA